jgi:uncharacterized membrane protein YfcA
MAGDLLIGALLAFLIATATAPVGVSGAVFLIPVQLSILHTPSPAITPTNLLYNLIAIPGALARYGRRGSLWSPLTKALVLGTLPGVIAGAVIRVELLSGPEAFLLVVASVLAPLGAWLLLFPPPTPRAAAAGIGPRITAIAAAVGVVGGIYGVGGGSILAPLLVGLGFTVAEVAPAALTSTFLTSLAGVLTFAVLGLRGDGQIAPDWLLGVSIGLGGLAGSYLGALLQPRLPEGALRRLLGFLALALALRYLLQALL